MSSIKFVILSFFLIASGKSFSQTDQAQQSGFRPPPGFRGPPPEFKGSRSPGFDPNERQGARGPSFSPKEDMPITTQDSLSKSLATLRIKKAFC